MLDCLLDGLIDTLKLLPYLLVTFLILELLEHKLKGNNEKLLKKNKKFGPVVGGILGALPQCGFSSMAANLFSGRVITMGTLIAVFLSTSDEMLPGSGAHRAHEDWPAGGQHNRERPSRHGKRLPRRGDRA